MATNRFATPVWSAFRVVVGLLFLPETYRRRLTD